MAVVASACGSVSEGMRADAGQSDSARADVGPIDGEAATCATTPPNQRARYRAENNTNDHAGNFNGSSVGANFSYTAGKYGSAFLLDGIDDVVTINDGEQLWPSSSFTLEAWIKTTAAKPANIVLCKYSCGNQCPTGVSFAYFCLYTDQAGHPSFDFRSDVDASIRITRASLASVNDNTWHHLVGVRDVATMTSSLYVDGTLAASSNLPASELGPMTDADNDIDLVTIGSNVVAGQMGYESLFGGAIDEAAIYHSALDAAQVSAIYNAPNGKCL